MTHLTIQLHRPDRYLMFCIKKEDIYYNDSKQQMHYSDNSHYQADFLMKGLILLLFCDEDVECLRL